MNKVNLFKGIAAGILIALSLRETTAHATLSEDASSVADRVHHERMVQCAHDIRVVIKAAASSGLYNVTVLLGNISEGVNCSKYQEELTTYYKSQGFIAYEPWASVYPTLRLEW